jgi:hypothetical protein
MSRENSSADDQFPLTGRSISKFGFVLLYREGYPGSFGLIRGGRFKDGHLLTLGKHYDPDPGVQRGRDNRADRDPST